MGLLYKIFFIFNKSLIDNEWVYIYILKLVLPKVYK